MDRKCLLLGALLCPSFNSKCSVPPRCGCVPPANIRPKLWQTPPHTTPVITMILDLFQHTTTWNSSVKQVRNNRLQKSDRVWSCWRLSLDRRAVLNLHVFTVRYQGDEALEIHSCRDYNITQCADVHQRAVRPKLHREYAMPAESDHVSEIGSYFCTVLR